MSMQIVSMTRFVDWSCQTCGAFIPANVAHGKPECVNPVPFLPEPASIGTLNQRIADLERENAALRGLLQHAVLYTNGSSQTCKALRRDIYAALAGEAPIPEDAAVKEERGNAE